MFFIVGEEIEPLQVTMEDAPIKKLLQYKDQFARTYRLQQVSRNFPENSNVKKIIKIIKKYLKIFLIFQNFLRIFQKII